jgi:hypothetical protein
MSTDGMQEEGSAAQPNPGTEQEGMLVDTPAEVCLTPCFCICVSLQGRRTTLPTGTFLAVGTPPQPGTPARLSILPLASDGQLLLPVLLSASVL